MQFWLGLVLGLILGWIIEWIIDWWFWRGGSGGSAISSSYGGDLTRITGINSDYEGRLKASGISSVASLAGSSPTAVRSAIGGSDGKSIDAEAWIVEAGGLSGSAKAGGAKTGAASGSTPNLATSLTSGGASAGSGSGAGASGSAGKGSGSGTGSGASAGSGSGKGSGSGSAGSGSGSGSPSARAGSGSGAGKGSGASAGTASGSGSTGSGGTGSGSGSSSPSARAGSGSAGSSGSSSPSARAGSGSGTSGSAGAGSSASSPAKPATRSTVGASASPSSGASAGTGSGSGRVAASGSGSADRKDNLTKIHGVGKVFQGKFYDAGITTWEGVSKLSDAEIRSIIQPKEWQKIETDVWIEEARILAGGGVARGGSAQASSGRGDDLTKIHGVGKVYQGKFNDAGVYLWSEVAQLSDERILEIIEPEGWQKIEPEEWKSEARQFAAKKGGDA